jgi:FAD synthase
MVEVESTAIRVLFHPKQVSQMDQTLIAPPRVEWGVFQGQEENQQHAQPAKKVLFRHVSEEAT